MFSYIIFFKFNFLFLTIFVFIYFCHIYFGFILFLLYIKQSLFNYIHFINVFVIIFALFLFSFFCCLFIFYVYGKIRIFSVFSSRKAGVFKVIFYLETKIKITRPFLGAFDSWTVCRLRVFLGQTFSFPMDPTFGGVWIPFRFFLRSIPQKVQLKLI